MPLNAKIWPTRANSNLRLFLTHDINDLVFCPYEVGSVSSFVKLLNERIHPKIPEVLKIRALSKNTRIAFDFSPGRT